jgi:hypothetical protein
MQRDWEIMDQDAEGPDAYVEGDEMEYEVEDQSQPLTESASVQNILRCEYSSKPQLFSQALSSFVRNAEYSRK